MYRTGPPPGTAGEGEDAGSGGLPRLTRAERRVFEGISPTAFDPQLRVFLADMVRPYGLPLREDLLREGAGHNYGEMAEPLVLAAVPDGRPVDLLVLAFAIHDVRLGRATALYLSEVCPGEPMAFAICDQGAAGAFTALRLVGEYARTGGCRRSLLLVAEQSALHYQPAGPAPVPERHAAVALLFEDAAGAEFGPVRQHPDVPPERVGALLAAEVAELSARRDDVTLVLGGGLAGFASAGLAWPGAGLVGRVRTAPVGQPFTGPWWELAGGLPAWAAGSGLVLLAEYEAGLRYLSVSALDFGVARPVVARPGRAQDGTRPGGAPQDRAPQDRAPQDRAPQDRAPQQAGARADVATQAGARPGGTPRDAAPQVGAPQGSHRGRVAP